MKKVTLTYKGKPKVGGKKGNKITIRTPEEGIIKVDKKDVSNIKEVKHT